MTPDSDGRPQDPSHGESTFARGRFAERVIGLTRQLARSQRQHVASLVSYGPTGCQLGELWQALRPEVERSTAGLTAIRWMTLQFPRLRERLYAELEYEFETQLAAQPEETAQELLQRRAPPPGQTRRRVVWLDWGVFTDGQAPHERLTLHELQTWLQFCSDFLAAHCPPSDVRVVSHLAIETTLHDELDGFLDAQLEESWCTRAECRLHPLPFEAG